MSSIIGKNLKLSLFGESHGGMVGVVIDGLKAGLKLDSEYIEKELDKRRSHNELSTARKEADKVEFISGYFNGFTTGTPLTLIIFNQDTSSSDYKPNLLRPGHADYTAFLKYDGYQDYRGGGHFSGRMTAPLVAAGAIFKQILENKGILIATHIKQIYDVIDIDFSINKIELEKQIRYVNNLQFAAISPIMAEAMQNTIKKAKEDLDSVGGILETVVMNMEGGIGEPFFDSVESVLSSLVFSIPGVKGVEFGRGFDFAAILGSKANDAFVYQEGEGIKTSSNNNGGINGGITNGMPILMRTVVKPTPSIAKEQNTVDLLKNKNTTIKVKGRHDPCIVHRARVVVDSMVAFGLLDLYCSRYGYMWME